MTASEFRSALKPWMLPIAMLCGMLLHGVIEAVAFIAPALIFTMLLITYCRVRPSKLRLSAVDGWLIAMQVIGSLAIYLLLRPFSEIAAQAAFICVFCPTATAAPVITGMLGGSIERLAAFSLISNITVAILAPIIFAEIGHTDSGITFLGAFATISWKVVPMILGPLLIAMTMLKFTPKAYTFIGSHQSLSFYIWAFSLIIVVGRAVTFVMAEPADRIPLMLIIAALALAVCVLQFAIGRRIGSAYGDKVSAGQGLGQKNTVLAIWMTLTWLNPLASVGPAAYILWQNTINSIQIYLHNRNSQCNKKAS